MDRVAPCQVNATTTDGPRRHPAGNATTTDGPRRHLCGNATILMDRVATLPVTLPLLMDRVATRQVTLPLLMDRVDTLPGNATLLMDRVGTLPGNATTTDGPRRHPGSSALLTDIYISISVIAALHTNYIDNVILAYNPDVPHKDDEGKKEDTLNYSNKASPISLGSNVGKISTSEVDADNEADARKCEAMLPGIKVLWAVLEEYVKNGQVNQLGVADVGGGCLYKLHAWAKVKPAIAQINLASCCVVPPSLHAFCRANDVQLLTHADPPDLLSLAAVKTLSDAGVGCNNLDWCARYQVHIKCRGVLALKGYVCKATLGKEVK
ncbi:uncharacterized protein [Choristoneura fumiferana]|uniref:uncharacterized protein n=1 Tax=Choristoneura fumiferana TaxID=7141 RepID=UPI003D15DBA1